MSEDGLKGMVVDEKFEAAMQRFEALPKVSKVLRVAAEHLEKGWCQGALGINVTEVSDPGCIAPVRVRSPLTTEHFQPGAHIDEVCLMGAILKAAVDLTGEPWDVPSKGSNAGALYDAGQGEVLTQLHAEESEEIARFRARMAVGLTLPSWNDAKNRTAGEVLGVVRAAADRLEARGR